MSRDFQYSRVGFVLEFSYVIHHTCVVYFAEHTCVAYFVQHICMIYFVQHICMAYFVQHVCIGNTKKMWGYSTPPAIRDCGGLHK